MTTTTRRAVLAGAAAVTLTIPSIAEGVAKPLASPLASPAATLPDARILPPANPAAALSQPDPIFAAIGRYREADRAFNEALRVLEQAELAKDRTAFKAARIGEDETGDAYCAACDEVLSTVPTTTAGMLALLALLEVGDAVTNGRIIIDAECAPVLIGTIAQFVRNLPAVQS